MEKTVKVGEDDPSYSKWVIEDAVAQGWLSKTMEPHLIGVFIELPTARDIWDSITLPKCSMTEKMKPNIMNCVVIQPRFNKMDKRCPSRMECVQQM